MAVVTSCADRPWARSAAGSRSTWIWRCLPPNGKGSAAPATEASPVRITVLPVSKISVSDSCGLVSASCTMGTVDASYDSTNGGVVPGGAARSKACDTAVICATASSGFTPCWKKYFTTDMPPSDCDSVCSMPVTVVCAVRSASETMRLAISSGGRPL